jgi:hypothetical protein
MLGPRPAERCREGDKGSGVIKPSGSDQTVAIISDDHLLVQPKDMPAKVWQYNLGANPKPRW